MKRILAWILLGLGGAVASLAQVAPYGTTNFQVNGVAVASQYGRWQVPSANNGFTFPLNYCYPSIGAGAGSRTIMPFTANAPIKIVDINPALTEIVVPTAPPTLTTASCAVSISPVNQHTSFYLTSGTAGLQEAINDLMGTSAAGGVVELTREFTDIGGTPAMLNAALATLPGSVSIQDLRTVNQPFLGPRPSSVTPLASPAATTTATPGAGYLTSATTGGTLPASSAYRVAMTYVDNLGGETTISTDTATTSVVTTGVTATNTISLTSPAALAGAVGYRVYVSAAAGAAGSEILYSPTVAGCAASTLETVLPACAIGSNSTIAAIVTGAAVVPVQATAHTTTVAPSGTFQQPFQTVYAPFANTGAIVAGNAAQLGVVNLPTGYLNTPYKTIRACGSGAAVSTGAGTFTLNLGVFSVPGVSGATPFSVASGTTTAGAVVSFDFCITMTTASTGTAGTVETHGWVSYGLAGTAAATNAIDTTLAVSNPVNLAAQNQLIFSILPTTTGSSGALLRQLTIETLN